MSNEANIKSINELLCKAQTAYSHANLKDCSLHAAEALTAAEELIQNFKNCDNPIYEQASHAAALANQYIYKYHINNEEYSDALEAIENAFKSSLISLACFAKVYQKETQCDLTISILTVDASDIPFFYNDIKMNLKSEDFKEQIRRRLILHGTILNDYATMLITVCDFNNAEKTICEFLQFSQHLNYAYKTDQSIELYVNARNAYKLCDEEKKKLSKNFEPLLKSMIERAQNALLRENFYEEFKYATNAVILSENLQKTYNVADTKEMAWFFLLSGKANGLLIDFYFGANLYDDVLKKLMKSLFLLYKGIKLSASDENLKENPTDVMDLSNKILIKDDRLAESICFDMTNTAFNTKIYNYLIDYATYFYLSGVTYRKLNDTQGAQIMLDETLSLSQQLFNHYQDDESKNLIVMANEQLAIISGASQETKSYRGDEIKFNFVEESRKVPKELDLSPEFTPSDLINGENYKNYERAYDVMKKAEDALIAIYGETDYDYRFDENEEEKEVNNNDSFFDDEPDNDDDFFDDEPDNDDGALLTPEIVMNNLPYIDTFEYIYDLTWQIFNEYLESGNYTNAQTMIKLIIFGLDKESGVVRKKLSQKDADLSFAACLCNLYLIETWANISDYSQTCDDFLSEIAKNYNETNQPPIVYDALFALSTSFFGAKDLKNSEMAFHVALEKFEQFYGKKDRKTIIARLFLIKKLLPSMGRIREAIDLCDELYNDAQSEFGFESRVTQSVRLAKIAFSYASDKAFSQSFLNYIHDAFIDFVALYGMGDHFSIDCGCYYAELLYASGDHEKAQKFFVPIYATCQELYDSNDQLMSTCEQIKDLLFS